MQCRFTVGFSRISDQRYWTTTFKGDDESLCLVALCGETSLEIDPCSPVHFTFKVFVSRIPGLLSMDL